MSVVPFNARIVLLLHKVPCKMLELKIIIVKKSLIIFVKIVFSYVYVCGQQLVIDEV